MVTLIVLNMTAKTQMVLSMTGTSQHNSKDTEAHDSQTQSDDGQRTTGRCFYAKKEFVFFPAVPGGGAFWLNCQDGHAGKRFLTERSVQSLNAYTSVQK